MAENKRIEYNWINGVETLEEYRPGGYHPIMIGDVLNGRYHIADKLALGAIQPFGLPEIFIEKDMLL